MRLTLQLRFAYLIISVCLFFNISQKPRFNKVLDLARNSSKGYNPPKIKLIAKFILDVIYDHNTQRNLIIIKLKQIVLDCYFLGMVLQFIELHC